MLRTEQQEIIKNYRKTNDYEFALKLAREMLIVRHLGLEAENFEEDEDYNLYQTNNDYYIEDILKKEFIKFYELYDEGGNDILDRFYLGKDNKFYDQYFCEVPLKNVKKILGANKGDLLKMKIDTTIETKTGEVDCLNDWENLSL